MIFCNIYYIIIFTIVTLSICVFFIYMFNKLTLNTSNKDKYTNNNIYFMTYKETADFLLMDSDKYVQNMSEIDLFARKAESTDEYRKNVSDLAISFQEDHKSKLLKCSKEADLFLDSYDFKKEKSSYKMINGKDLSQIKWIFALTQRLNNREYEDGLPHTRGNVIFISLNVLNYEETDFINTLIHEKIHIYQRNNKILFQKILSEMGYSIIDRNILPYKRFIRANPDTDGNIYYDKKTNKEMVCIYRNENPSGLNDVIVNNFSLEHPYEKIAYDIANKYYVKNAKKYIDI